jgi:hypothetical protein
VCGTEVCVSSPSLLFFFCYPSAILQQLPEVSAIVVLQLGSDKRYQVSPPVCPVTPPTASIPLPVDTDQPSSDVLLPTSATGSGAAAAVLTAVVGAAAIVGVDAADAQMLVSILASPCVCRTAASSSQAPLLILSPLAHLGPSWSVIGSVLTCVALTGLHGLGVAVLLSQHKQPSQQRGRCRGAQMHCTTLLGRWLAERHRRRDIAAMLRFPNVSIIVLMFLLPGVARSSVQVASALDSSNLDTGVDITAIVTGCLFCCAGVALVELMVYRHICVELARKRGGGRSAIQFAMYHHVHKLFAPIPRAVAVVALPVGSWEPRRSRISFGGVVSGFRGEWHHTWRILLATNVFVQILSGIGNACDAVQGLTLGALVIACSVIAATRPHRALLASLFVCCSFLLSICSVVLGMLCRHGQVDSDALNSFGVFASFMLAVFKCYNVGMPFVERWLVQRNSPREIDAAPSMIESDGAAAEEHSPGASTTSSLGSAHKRSRLTQPSPLLAPPDIASPAVAVSLLPLSDQLQVLQQLILLAAERVQHTEHL